MGYWEKHGLSNPEHEEEEAGLASYEKFATDKGGPEPLPGGKALLFHPDDEKIDASELDKAINTAIEPEVNEEDIEEPEAEMDELEMAPPIPVYKGRVPEGFEAEEEDEAVAEWEKELAAQETAQAEGLVDPTVADKDVDEWDELKERVNVEDFDNKPPRVGSRKDAAVNVKVEDSTINKRAAMRFDRKQKGKAVRK